MFFKKKGQGSLEYLLLIGGAVLVAAIVIALVISSGTAGGTEIKLKTAASLCYARVAQSPAPTVAVQGTTYWCCSKSALTIGTSTYTGAVGTAPGGGSLPACAEYVASGAAPPGNI